jgi:hypothetical protein
MPIKPGPQLISIGGVNLLADSIQTTYATEFFDRVEFDHEKLKAAPLSTGVTPLVVQLIGNIPAEIVIDCALTGIIGTYVPRPLNPNIIPTDTNNIKQRIDIVRYTISGGTTPESASAGANVDSVFSYAESDKDKLAQFQNRLAIFNTSVAYEQLLAAQADNIYSLYFSTGRALDLPLTTYSDVIITDFSYTYEYIIPNVSSSYDIYKGYNMVVEYRTVTSASAS